MKQKLLRNRLNGAEGEATEVDEEEKKRIVLGSVSNFMIFPNITFRIQLIKCLS